MRSPQPEQNMDFAAFFTPPSPSRLHKIFPYSL